MVLRFLVIALAQVADILWENDVVLYILRSEILEQLLR